MTDIRTMVRSDPRMAGAVARYHTWPTIQTQTVAQASWNVARILAMIWRDAPAAALTHALFNDCGEIKSGDLPFPIKRDNPTLKAEICRIEAESFREQGIADLAEPDLEEIWVRRVKICDMLEMWEFGLDEVALGNRYARPIVEATADSVAELTGQFRLSPDDCTLILEYMAWRNSKTPR